MKRLRKLVWLVIIIAFIAAILALRDLPINGNRDDLNFVRSQERESIAFIMGEDSNPENLFYAKATDYYRYSQTDRTEYVITSCRSLVEVRNYLKNNPPSNNHPWGVINIVAHSNEWSGLGVPIIPGGKRTTTESLMAAIESGRFLALANNIVDAQTEIRIHGCALGRDQELLTTVSKAFGGDDIDLQRPVVRSCRYFLFYETTRHKGQLVGCKQYMSDFWYAFYRTGYRPGDIRLSNQLRQRYPEVDMDWRDALTRTKPRWLGDSFHYTFRVPIKWIVTYPDPDSRPDLTKKGDQQAWINEQTELQQYLDDFGIPIDCFRWRFKNIDYTYDDGPKEAAIRAVGNCTVLCVLKVLTVPDLNDPTNRQPLSPSVTDNVYYEAEIPGMNAVVKKQL